MKRFNSSWLFLAIIFSWNLLQSQDLPERPDRLVNDRAGVLTQQQISALEQKLVAFSDTNSTQIAVLIVPDLMGYDISDYAQRVAQKWGVGQKKYDNGVIIVVKPKKGSERGQANINVGYGLEPLIPDITAKRIIENEMIPHFREDDYYGGINSATDVIISLAAGKFTADDYQNRSEDNGPIGFIIPIIILIIVLSIINRGRSNHTTLGGKGSSSLWTALWLASMMNQGRSGSFGNFKSGSGNFGGFGGGGGGFGGFGGGRFGGGGASGSW